MLQISQTENPKCSAPIDQVRLRRAMTWPLEFQNVSSSGFQSEIQVGSWVLIRYFLSTVGSAGGMETRSGGAPVWRCHTSDDWFRWTESRASGGVFQPS